MVETLKATESKDLFEWLPDKALWALNLSNSLGQSTFIENNDGCTANLKLMKADGQYYENSIFIPSDAYLRDKVNRMDEWWNKSNSEWYKLLTELIKQSNELYDLTELSIEDQKIRDETWDRIAIALNTIKEIIWWADYDNMTNQVITNS